MKIGKKIITGLIINIIITGILISGCITITNREKDDSETGKNLKNSYVFTYGPEIVLPEVFIEERSIWGSELNFSKWSYGPFIETYLKKYSNYSKEVLEIMKMQVLLLGEDLELFEKCLTGNKSGWSPHLGDKSLDYPEDFVNILCWAWKGELKNYFGYNGTVWAFTSIIRANELIEMETYYVNTTTFEILPFKICTD